MRGCKEGFSGCLLKNSHTSRRFEQKILIAVRNQARFVQEGPIKRVGQRIKECRAEVYGYVLSFFLYCDSTCMAAQFWQRFEKIYRPFRIQEIGCRNATD